MKGEGQEIYILWIAETDTFPGFRNILCVNVAT